MAAVDTGVRDRTGAALSIGQLATASGVSSRSLRYYEEQGLIVAHRTESGHRRYDPACVDRVVLIQRMFAAGLSSAAIAPILPCMLDESKRTAFLVGELRRHRDRLAAEVRRQQETVRILDEVIDEYDNP
ncbi:MerR family transcriptional regulator [Micromonospora fluostatini]|uniref:MerR family transcriptional regulator n=1 Tax=Micromonospora sp. JCM 30529 TaxID=3421643 RepID=UPI003D183A57